MKFRLLAFALLLSGGVSAQNPYISLQGANETAGGLTVAQPRTILAVDVTVEHDVTLSGPYARYAQKYLGACCRTPPPKTSSRACSRTRLT